MERIGIVGVGRMGANIARRLKECGYPIAAIYDSNADAGKVVAKELGAPFIDSLSEVTKVSDVIITAVTDDLAMKEIYERPKDNLFMGAPNKFFINCATISPSVHIFLMQKAVMLGAHMLEAPMAGSIDQAKAGKLFLMIAGERADVEKLTPLFKSLSSDRVYTGAPGTAANLKALVNMVMNINTAALAEGLGLADSLGMDLAMVSEVFAKTGAASRVLETDGTDMLTRDHETYFSAAHAAKDSGIATELGRSQGLPMVLASATEAQYQSMVLRGLGHLDKSGIAEMTFKSRLADHTPVLTPA